MVKYYKIPKSGRNPRAVHLYDILAMVLMLVAALTALPLGKTLDLSVGFQEKSEAYLAEEARELNTQFENGAIPSSSLRSMFRISCLQTGGYVYAAGEDYYSYQERDKGLGYYREVTGEGVVDRVDSMRGSHPRGLICNGVCIAVEEDGRIFFDDLEGRGAYMDARVNMEEPASLEEANRILHESRIPCLDAAKLWVLIEQDVLIGYDDDAAWFHKETDGVHRFYRGTGKGVEEKFSLEGPLWDAMVIDDRYLIYAMNGDLYFRWLETGETTYHAISENAELGELRQLAYLLTDKDHIRVYALNSGKAVYFDLTGNGLEMEGTKMNGKDFSNVSGLYLTGTGDVTLIWFKEPGQYVFLKKEN